jgi:hypothetical protein
LSIAQGTELADFSHDVLGRSLAVLEFLAGLFLYMIYVIVNHGKGDAD